MTNRATKLSLAPDGPLADVLSDLSGYCRNHADLSDWFSYRINDAVEYAGFTVVRATASAHRFRKGGKSFTEEKAISMVLKGEQLVCFRRAGRPRLVFNRDEYAAAQAHFQI